MTRDEKLEALAQVLLTASRTPAPIGYLSRETALALQIEGVAMELKALAVERCGAAEPHCANYCRSADRSLCSEADYRSRPLMTVMGGKQMDRLWALFIASGRPVPPTLRHG